MLCAWLDTILYDDTTDDWRGGLPIETIAISRRRCLQWARFARPTKLVAFPSEVELTTMADDRQALEQTLLVAVAPPNCIVCADVDKCLISINGVEVFCAVANAPAGRTRRPDRGHETGHVSDIPGLVEAIDLRVEYAPEPAKPRSIGKTPHSPAIQSSPQHRPSNSAVRAGDRPGPLPWLSTASGNGPESSGVNNVPDAQDRPAS